MSSSLAVLITGVFEHPLDRVPIDCRHCETIEATQFADKRLIEVTDPQTIDTAMLKARGVLITNLAGTEFDRWPNDEQGAAIASQRIRVRIDGYLELSPCVPGKTPHGQSVFLPLGPGARVSLESADGTEVPVKVIVFPGDR